MNNHNNREINIEVDLAPLYPKGFSPSSRDSQRSRESPRCMLRIPEKVTSDMLKVPLAQFPSINKQKTSPCNSPLPLSPRIIKDKNYEFPDPNRVNLLRDDSEVKFDKIDRENIRGMRKHSSNKKIRQNHFELPEISKAAFRKNSERPLERKGVYVYDD
jgi:hypothetical protein